MVISSFYLTLAFSSLRRRPHRHRHPDGLVDGVIAIISPLLSLRRRRPTDTVILAVDRRGHRHPGGLVDGGIAIISPLFSALVTPPSTDGHRHPAVDQRGHRHPGGLVDGGIAIISPLFSALVTPPSTDGHRHPCGRPTRAPSSWRSRSRDLALAPPWCRPGCATAQQRGHRRLPYRLIAGCRLRHLVPPSLRHCSTTRVSSSSLPSHSGISPSSRPRAALVAPPLNNAGIVVFLAVS